MALLQNKRSVERVFFIIDMTGKSVKPSREKIRLTKVERGINLVEKSIVMLCI